MATAAEINKLQRDHRAVVRTLNNLKSSIESNLKSSSLDIVHILETQIQEYQVTKEKHSIIIEKLIDSFDRSDETKQKKADEDEEKYLSEKDVVLNHYCSLSAKIKVLNIKVTEAKQRESLASSTLNTSFNQNQSSACKVKLERISVPTFDGGYKHFVNFKDMYVNLIHNEPELSHVQKLHYLKKSLTGKAAYLLNDVLLTDASYVPAWNRVLEKYDDKCKIVKSHLESLFSIDRVKSEKQLMSLYESFDGAVRNLKSSGEATEQWSTILAYMLYSKLDNRTRRDFKDAYTDKAKFFAYPNILSFVSKRASNVEDFDNEDESDKPKQKSFNSKTTESSKHSHLVTDKTTSSNLTKRSCPICGQIHRIIDCSNFVSKTPSQRFEAIKKNQLCIACFGINHTVKECKKNWSCRTCGGKHHTLLHFPTAEDKSFNTTNPVTVVAVSSRSPAPAESKLAISNTTALNSPTSSNSTAISHCLTQARKTVILPTALVRFTCGKTTGVLRVMLDSCSQGTLVAEEFIRKFKLPTSRSSTIIEGVGKGTITSQFSCKLNLQSRFRNFNIDVVANVVPKIAMPYSLKDLPFSDYHSSLKQLELADTAFAYPCVNAPPVDLLLGAEYYDECQGNETKQIGSLHLRLSRFGWTVSGKIVKDLPHQHESSTFNFCNLVITEQIKEFFDQEVFDSPSQEDTEKCEEHFKRTYTRLSNGQFQVKLPFKEDVSLADNRKKATAHFKAFERKRSEVIKPLYASFMEEYERLNHMSLTFRHGPPPRYYIPHLPVYRPSSTTTKLRVVFHASSKTSSGYSLNDALLVGANLQPLLFDTLVRFRSYNVGVTADIEKMYRCI